MPLAAAALVVIAAETYAQRPMWGSQPVLVVVDLGGLVTFMVTGVLLKDEPGQRGGGGGRGAVLLRGQQ